MQFTAELDVSAFAILSLRANELKRVIAQADRDVVIARLPAQLLYFLAKINDVSRVALECGNSQRDDIKHYRELVTPDDAAEWFLVSPAAND